MYMLHLESHFIFRVDKEFTSSEKWGLTLQKHKKNMSSSPLIKLEKGSW